MNYPIDISETVLENDKVLLRAFSKEDLADFYAYARVVGVGELAGWTHHKSKAESKSILKTFIKNKNVFAIVLKAENKVIGSFGLERYNIYDFDDAFNQQYLGREIGYVLSKDYWNQGIMSECLKLVIEYLFEELNLDFLVCRYTKDNFASKRVAEKSGFKYLKDITIRNSDQQDVSGELAILLNHTLLNKVVKIV